MPALRVDRRVASVIPMLLLLPEVLEASRCVKAAGCALTFCLAIDFSFAALNIAFPSRLPSLTPASGSSAKETCIGLQGLEFLIMKLDSLSMEILAASGMPAGAGAASCGLPLALEAVAAGVACGGTHPAAAAEPHSWAAVCAARPWEARDVHFGALHKCKP